MTDGRMVESEYIKMVDEIIDQQKRKSTSSCEQLIIYRSYSSIYVLPYTDNLYIIECIRMTVILSGSPLYITTKSDLSNTTGKDIFNYDYIRNLLIKDINKVPYSMDMRQYFFSQIKVFDKLFQKS